MSIISCPTGEKLADLFINPLQGSLLKFLRNSVLIINKWFGNYSYGIQYNRKHKLAVCTSQEPHHTDLHHTYPHPTLDNVDQVRLLAG